MQAGLISHQGYISDKIMQIKHEIPIWSSVFLGG